MMKFFTFTLVVLGCLQLGYALRCYSGTGETNNYVTCTGSCVKSIAFVGDSSAAVYACSPIKMDEGCSDVDPTIVVAAAEVCYCNTDLCNASGTARLAVPLLLLSVLMKVLL